MSTPKILAVDVGYGNVKVFGTSCGDASNEQGFHFPALAGRVVSSQQSAEYGAAVHVTRVRVGDDEYWVGKDTPEIVRRHTRSALESAYPMTPQYKALLLGALHASGLSRIDVLALGLPAQFIDNADMVQAMKDRYVGEHLCSDRRVYVDQVRVYSQPVGGLASFAFEPAVMDIFKNNRCLVIDPGYNTVDWTVVASGKVLRSRNDSVKGGMAEYLRELEQAVQQKYPEMQFNTTYPLDAAVRGEKALSYNGAPVDISAEIALAMPAWDNAIDVMVSATGSLKSYADVYVVGGAAPLMVAALKKRYDGLNVKTSESLPILANARGFFVMARKAWNNAAMAGGNLPKAPPPDNRDGRDQRERGTAARASSGERAAVKAAAHG